MMQQTKRKKAPGSRKQIEFWKNCTHRWNIKTGATRSGKTYMDYFLIPKRLLAGKGKDGLNVILGNTRETIRRNVILPMMNIYGEHRISNIHSDNSCTMFGEKVFVLGADNIGHVDKIRGMSIKYAYGDEVTTWNREIFDMLKSRLDKSYSLFDGTCNPSSPGHWFKEFLDSDADIYQQHYSIFDNPYLSQDFVDNLCKEYAGTVYYGRYIEGEWTLAEGLIYPMYHDAVKTPVTDDYDRYVLSVDYGTLNAFAALLWGYKDGIWWCCDEYYYSGRDTGTQKTDEEYAADLDAWLKDKEGIRTIVDPSAASFIALLRKRKKYRVIPADNAVLDGIRETATAMKTGKIAINEECKNLIQELQGYIWDEGATEDKPTKVNDHACDAMRYFVKTMKVSAKKSHYKSVWEGETW